MGAPGRGRDRERPGGPRGRPPADPAAPAVPDRRARHRPVLRVPRAAGPAPAGRADPPAGRRVVRRAHRRVVRAAARGPGPAALHRAPAVAAQRRRDLARPALGGGERPGRVDPGRRLRGADRGGRGGVPGPGGIARDPAARLPREHQAGPGHHRLRDGGHGGGGGAVAAARLRPAGRRASSRRLARPSWPCGSATCRRPGARPWTPGRPRSAGSSATCTTGRRPGWWPWA